MVELFLCEWQFLFFPLAFRFLAGSPLSLDVPPPGHFGGTRSARDLLMTGKRAGVVPRNAWSCSPPSPFLSPFSR